MRPIIVGHRGAAGVAPENTLAGFRRAVEMGVRVIELDVHLSRDGRPVCFHDDRLERVTSGSGRVADLDWEALADLPVMPGGFGGAFPGGRIPLLQSVLVELPECEFVVELKADVERPDELVARTLEVIAAAGAGDRCRLISFEQDLLRRVRASSDLPLGVLVGNRTAGELFDRAREVRAAALHPQHSLVDEALVRRAAKEGFLINAWTVNSEEEVRRLATLGVHEITADFPDRVQRAIGGEPSP